MPADSRVNWYPYNLDDFVEDAFKQGEDSITLPTATTTLAVTDDDSAATNGTAVNVVPENTGVLAHLESTTAGNANAVVDDSNGDAILVVDNDTPGGVALYFDEDATQGSRFLADLSSYATKDVWVLTSGGNAFKVTHNASPGTPGVQVYFDDDGATEADRLLFVSPTDTDGVEVASPEMGLGYLGVARSARS